MAHSSSKFLKRKPLEEAREALLAAAEPIGSERIATEDAHDRVTADAVFAVHASPHYRASAMDGIAVRAVDTYPASGETPVVLTEVAPATDVAERPAVCQVIDTGGVMPQWSDAMIRREDTRAADGGFEIGKAVPPGTDVRRAGEDLDEGVRVVPAGHRVRPADIGALLACGVYAIDVRRRPRVAILATGGEIVEPVERARAGEVIEYNSRMMRAQIREWGGEGVYLGCIDDDADALERAFREAGDAYDVVAVIAGSSAGRKDLTPVVFERCGEVFVHGMDVMPGKPVALATIEGTPFVGLPGYPVSAIVACEQLLEPLLAHMCGRSPSRPTRIQAEVRRKIPSRLGVEEFRRVCLATEGTALVVAPLPRGAGAVSTVARADAWLRIPSTSEGIDGGATVDVELLRPLDVVRANIVMAGRAGRLTAALEHSLRSEDRVTYVSHLDLSETDQVEALVAGEAHLLAVDCGDRKPAETARAILARSPGARAWTLVRTVAGAQTLVIAAGSFLAGEAGARTAAALDSGRIGSGDCCRSAPLEID